MTSREATISIIAALESMQVPYMVAGSLSSNVYGIARSTQDANVVVQVGDTTIVELAQLLGPRFKLNPQMTFETVTGTMRFVFVVEKVPFKIELFLLSDDAHDQSRFARRVRVSVMDRECWVASPEDVVVTKLRWMRKKDREDVENVIRVRQGKLDWPYIEQWCDRHGTRELLEKIRREVAKLEG